MMNTFTKLVFAFLLFTAITCKIQAQDIHHSQFWANPVLLNPALTGNINGDVRVVANFRNQWASIPAPYSTISATVDASLLGCQLGNSHVGAGLALYNDRSGDGALNELTIAPSAAFHLGIDQDGRYVIAAGAQMSYTQKSVDFSKLTFETQIINFEPDPEAPNGEPVDRQKFSYLDFRAGGVFTGVINDRVNVYAGGAFYHLTKPEERFLVKSNEKNVLDNRLVFHAGGQIGVTDRFSILPNMLFMSQTGSKEITVGTAFGYNFSEQKHSKGRYVRGKAGRGGSFERSTDNTGSAIYLGAWYRLGDAIIPYLGVDYQGFRFGFSYDVNISDLDVASLNQGGVEISLMYTAKFTECQRKQPIYCPRF